MAKRKVVWSAKAKISFHDIISFYNIRNGNNRYSRKLYSDINKSVSLVRRNNFIGKNSDFKNFRVLINKNYQIFYSLTNFEIIIELIWDSRRNPEDINI